MERIETGDPWDTQALLAELRRYGAGYLMGEATELAERGFQLQPAEFVAALARSSDPRVRDTLISLLLHPDLANVTKDAIDTAHLSGDEQTAEQLITLALGRSISSGCGAKPYPSPASPLRCRKSRSEPTGVSMGCLRHR